MVNQYNELKEYLKKEIPNKNLLGDIRISETQYKLLIEYFIYQTLLEIKPHYQDGGYKLLSDPAYAVALVQIGIHFYDGRLWPHIEKILGQKINNSIRDRIHDRFFLTLKRYNKIVENDSEIVNTILMHGFVSNHYIGYLFDYLYRFYVIDLERDLTWEGYSESLNYMIDMIQKGEVENLSQSNRKYMLVKQTVDGIRVSKKQSVNMKFRWLLKTIDKLVFNDDVNEKSNSRLISEFINWSRNSENKKRFDREYNSSNKNKLKRNISPKIIYKPRNNVFTLSIPGQRFTARHSAEIEAYLTIGDKREFLNLGRNELSTLIKTNDYERDITWNDLFKPISIEIKIESFTKTFNVLTGDPFVVFDEDYESARIEKDRQILLKGQNYCFIKPDTILNSSCKLDLILKNIYFENYSFHIDDSDYIVINNSKLFIPKIQVEDGISSSYLVPNIKCSNFDVYKKVPLIFFKTKENAINGTIIKIDGQLIKDESLISTVEIYADSTIQAILNPSKYISNNGIHDIEIDVPNIPTRRYKFVLINELEYSFSNNPYIFVNDGVVEFNNENIKSNLENSNGVFQFEIDGNLEKLNFNFIEGNINLPLELDVPIFKIEYVDGSKSISSLGEIWHKDFPFDMRLKYSYPYKIFVDNDTEYDQTIEAEIHNGLYTCDLTKLKTYIYEGDDFQSKLYIESENQLFNFATIFTASQIIEVSPIEYDEDNSLIYGSFKMTGDDVIYLTATHIESKTIICDKQRIDSNTFSFMSDGLSGTYKLEFLIVKKGFGKSYKVIYTTTKRLITDNLENLHFQILCHYKGLNRFQPTIHNDKRYLSNLSKVEDNIYNAELIFGNRGKYSKDEVTPVKVEIIKKEHYWSVLINIIDEFEGEEDLIPLLFDRDYKYVIEEEISELPARSRYKRYKDLTDYTFDIKIVEDN